ncbi:MAG: hypothetical protein EKK55_10165 [Rhodocyclaceae bacterium]|nr:MAG: hypothetical protein EKK55_10165 [Rhodocyclaceae bacterium]
MPPDPHAMPASFRAALDAALARPLLLDPRALDAVRVAGGFAPRADMGDDEAGGPVATTRQGDVAIVTVRGPLAHRAWSCWLFSGDGYDAIEARVRAALADPLISSVVLRLDSPGGEVAGCFEAVRAIRAARAEADKPLIAYVDECACSAAYALACACDEIVCPDTGLVGSVGVITALEEESAALAEAGVSVAVVTSGEAKADGHPAVPLSADARARIQADIDYLAGVFAAEVAVARPLEAADVLALGARVYRGEQAVSAGLADRVGNLAAALDRAHALSDSAARGPAARRAPSTTAGRTPAPGAHRMNSILALLGLPESATEHDAAAAVTKATEAQRQILALTGASSLDAALGAIHGYKAEAAKVSALAAQLAEVRAAELARERAALLDAAVRDGRMAPAERASYESGPLAAAPIEFVRASLDARSPAPAVKLAPVAPVAGPPAGAITPEDEQVARMMGRDPKQVAARVSAAEVK